MKDLNFIKAEIKSTSPPQNIIMNKLNLIQIENCDFIVYNTLLPETAKISFDEVGGIGNIQSKICMEIIKNNLDLLKINYLNDITISNVKILLIFKIPSCVKIKEHHTFMKEIVEWGNMFNEDDCTLIDPIYVFRSTLNSSENNPKIIFRFFNINYTFTVERFKLNLLEEEQFKNDMEELNMNTTFNEDNFNISKELKNYLNNFLLNHSKNKLLIIVGPANVGKTEFIKALLKDYKPLIVKYKSDLKKFDSKLNKCLIFDNLKTNNLIEKEFLQLIDSTIIPNDLIKVITCNDLSNLFFKEVFIKRSQILAITKPLFNLNINQNVQNSEKININIFSYYTNCIQNNYDVTLEDKVNRYRDVGFKIDIF